jgi:uncharacterized protein YqeY
MGLADQISKDMTQAMRERNEQRLSTLRMVKTALKNKEVEKRGQLEEREAQQVLSTLIKQRKESIEQFQKGGRPELAEKEAAEIQIIESYMPKAAGAEEITAVVRGVIGELSSPPSMRDMGNIMKTAMAKFAESGTRVEGKVVSDIVKRELESLQKR